KVQIKTPAPIPEFKQPQLILPAYCKPTRVKATEPRTYKFDRPIYYRCQKDLAGVSVKLE
ncbi:MAG: hypothetical protein AAF512_21645, partial [Pseudomonadota bacterium]